MLTYLAIAALCFSGGLLSGMAGFGALILIVPALILLLGMETAIPLGVLCGVGSQFFNALPHYRHLHKRPLAYMILGGLPGLWLGSTLLSRLPESLLRAMLGLLLICYVLWSVSQKMPPPSRPPTTIWAVAAGFCSGALGGAFGINGPPAVIYVTRTGWSPKEMRAFLGAFCWLLFCFFAIILTIRGMLNGNVLKLAAIALPFCLLGNASGQIVSARLHPVQYLRLVFAMLFVMGITLCWPAVRIHILGW